MTPAEELTIREDEVERVIAFFRKCADAGGMRAGERLELLAAADALGARLHRKAAS